MNRKLIRDTRKQLERWIDAHAAELDVARRDAGERMLLDLDALLNTRDGRQVFCRGLADGLAAFEKAEGA